MKPFTKRARDPDPFPGLTQPGALRDAAGGWLTDRLPDFVWKRAAGELRRRVGTRSATVLVQGSPWNRSGIVTRFEVFAVSWDAGLARWREQNADRVLLNTPYVCRLYPSRELDLLDPTRRSQELRSMLAWLRAEALQFFDMTSDVERMASPALHAMDTVQRAGRTGMAAVEATSRPGECLSGAAARRAA